MENEQKKYWFFGSKLNTALLLVLIILMAIALKWMYENKALYVPVVVDQVLEPSSTSSTSTPSSIEGNKEDLVSFSIKPGQEVSGKMTATGSIKGGYFFEGNILVSILDTNKQITSYGPRYTNATSDWMTAGPVSFSLDIDFTTLPKGLYYIKLTQDDPSDGESGRPIKFVTIPVVVI